VAYRATGPVLHVGVCTCRACQRATGALESPNIGVRPSGFQILKGTPASFRSESNKDCDSGSFHFCGACGTQLFWRNATETEVALFAGALDSPELFEFTPR
jgi:hypothetical protein